MACAFILGGASVAALLLPSLHRRVTARAVVRDFREIANYIDPARDPGYVPIDCWGDSLTEGKGLAGHDYPHLLSYLFRRNTLNRGVSGETSRQIRTRMLARSVPGTPEYAVIWAGRNDDLGDVGVVERNIEEMVNSLSPGSHFLVLGVLNGDVVRERRGGERYDLILTLNDHLRVTYGKSFVPIRELLVSGGDGADEDDAEAIEADVVPPSLRVDALHLNDRGEALVAYAVEAAMKANGWR